MSLPGWKALPPNSSWPRVLMLCPKPWRYQSANELYTDSIRGKFSYYKGGGYVAVMGYDEKTAKRVLDETFAHGWVDRRTRAVILEFAVFNANTNLLGIATYLFEALASGGAYTVRTVDTLQLYNTESASLMFYLVCQFLFFAMVFYYLIVLLFHLYKQRLRFLGSVWNMVDFFMIVFSVLSVSFYMIRAKSILKSVKEIQNNPHSIVNFHRAIYWYSLENASIALSIFFVTLKLLNLIRFNPYVIFFFSSFRQSVGCQISYAAFFLMIFNAFAISGRLMFGSTVFEYASYIQAIISQFQFLLGRAVPLADLRSNNPFLGPSFAFTHNIIMTILLINMFVSLLNESYSEAKSNADESAEELEMARFISERFLKLFKEGQRSNDMKLYCDQFVFGNMCHSDAEPYCLNSEIIAECSDVRLEKLDKRLASLSRRIVNMETDEETEESDFLILTFYSAKTIAE